MGEPLRAVSVSACRRLTDQPPESVVLARGVWLKAVRGGDLVRRERPWWCPPPLGELLLRRLMEQAKRFEAFLPVVPLREDHDCHGAVLLQPYVAGAVPLRRLSAARLRDPTVVRSLCELWYGALLAWRIGGRLPDIGGRVHRPWELYRPLQTDNVVVGAGGKCWLVDVGASTAFHSARSPFGRLHAGFMVRALRQSMRQLGCGIEEPLS
jgi:hypothetical protein